MITQATVWRPSLIRPRRGDLAGHEPLGPPRRLVVVEDPGHGEEVVARAIGPEQEVAERLGRAVGLSWGVRRAARSGAPCAGCPKTQADEAWKNPPRHAAARGLASSSRVRATVPSSEVEPGRSRRPGQTTPEARL